MEFKNVIPTERDESEAHSDCFNLNLTTTKKTSFDTSLSRDRFKDSKKIVVRAREQFTCSIGQTENEHCELLNCLNDRDR